MQEQDSRAVAPGTKRCPRCLTTKPTADFGWTGGARKRRQAYCQPCRRALRGKATPEQYRRWSLSKRYGLTVGRYVGMAIRQGGRCAICREERRLEVDHDHTTGRVRGLICHSCNIGLVLLEDVPRLAAALRYLGACR
jgi:Autographiviridae endonuclease VII